MFHHQDIACHQVRTGDTSKLVVGKIPRLHAEDHANRAALHMGFAVGRMELHWRKKALGILRVVGEDSDAELDLAARLVDSLAHFERHRASKFVGLRMQNLCRLGHDDRALGIGLVPPSLEAGRRGRKLGLELLVGQFIELFQELAVGGIDALVGH